MSITNIILNNLQVSPLNVRKSKPKDIAALAADIDAHGLLQNLVGYKQGKTYQICAGGRRLQALRILAKQDKLSSSFKVPVSIRPKHEAIELSLAENSAREEMHRADAIEAYRALIEADMAPEDIAGRFGVSLSHVKRILKLAGLHDDIRAAFAADKINMGAAMAYTLTGDQERQRAVFEQWGNNERQIRKALTGEKIKTSSGLFNIVSVEAYKKAGGTITSDLFDADGHGYADNPEILSGLIDKALAEIGETLKTEGWSKVIICEGRPDNFYMLRHMDPEGQNEPSVKDQKEIEALEAEIETVYAEDPDAMDWSHDGLKAATRALGKIEAGLCFYTDEQKQNSEMLIFVDHSGSLHSQAIDCRKRSGGSDGAKSESKPDYSAALVDDLEKINALAAREAVAADSALASDLILISLIDGYLSYGWNSPLSLTSKIQNADVAEDMLVQSDLKNIENHPPLELTNLKDKNLFEAVTSMKQKTKDKLLGFLAGALVHKGNANIADILKRSKTDMATKWQPSVRFFERLSKSVMLKILTEQCGKEAADNCKSLKKGELAVQMADRIGGTGWMPEAMTFAGTEEDVKTAKAA